MIIPGVKIQLRVGEQQVEAVHGIEFDGGPDWCLSKIAPLVDGGQILSGKERCHPFMVVTKQSSMKSTASTATNFVDVNLWVVEQQLHHIVLAAESGIHESCYTITILLIDIGPVVNCCLHSFNVAMNAQIQKSQVTHCVLYCL